jgi:hypothetical protein
VTSRPFLDFRIKAMHLALVLEGGGATSQSSALRIPTLALAEAGAMVRTVAYPDWRPAVDDSTQRAAFCDQVAETVITEPIGQYGAVTFIAKSLGSVVLARLDPERFGAAHVSAIWLTPLLELDEVVAGIEQKSWPGLLVAGGADPSHIPQRHDGLVTHTGLGSLIIAGADHSLEVKDDVRATIEGLRELASVTLDFASANAGEDALGE